METKTYRAHLSSLSPYSQSKYHSSEKKNKESHDAYELAESGL